MNTEYKLTDIGLIRILFNLIVMKSLLFEILTKLVLIFFFRIIYFNVI